MCSDQPTLHWWLIQGSPESSSLYTSTPASTAASPAQARSGPSGRRIAEADALGLVLGYTCGNDVSQRPIQFAEMKMGTLLIGKGVDAFCPPGRFAITTGCPIASGDARRQSVPRHPARRQRVARG